MEEVITDPSFDFNSMMEPLFPVSTPEGNVPKMQVEEGGEIASVILEPDDLAGTYDYIPDVKSMSNPEPATVNALTQMMVFAKDPAAIQARTMDGQRIKLSEVEKDMFELLGLKNADKYYERADLNQIGGGAPIPGQTPGGAPGAGGVQTSTPPVA